jgi:ATP-dependent helicase IRC3
LKKLRDYQQSTLESVRSSFDNGISRQLIVLATGLGKTYTSISISQHFSELFLGHKRTGKVLFLVDQIELVDQTYKSFKNAFPHLSVGVEQADRKHNKTDDIVVACVPTIGREQSSRINQLNPDEFDVVIVDEAHKSVSETWVRTLDWFGVGPANHNSNKLLLGMTATANRADGVKLGKLYDDITVNYDLSWGIRNGWLTDIEVFNVKTDTDISKTKTRGGEFAQQELAEKINDHIRNTQIVKAYREFSDQESAIAFCGSVSHAYELTKLFEANGISSAVIEANTDKDERKELIEKYKRGEIKILTNFGTLTTGFDAPNTTTLIMARPVKSELLYRQMIGRGLRTHPDTEVDLYSGPLDRKFAIECSPKPACKVIDVEDITGKHETMSVPSLFGLSKKIAQDQPRFFKDVVEVIEAKEHELSVSLKHIEDLSEIDLIVERRKGNLGSLETPKEIHHFTDNAWIELGESHYELNLSSSKVSMVIVKNQLDQYEVREYNHKSEQTLKLQAFNNLSGAFQLADNYAKEHHDTKYQNRKAEWRGQGVSAKQTSILIKMLKGGIRVDRNARYSDTGLPHLYYKGELLTKGTASKLISELFKGR